MSKILIAEDESIYREYLAAALDADGHEVRSSVDGPDAIRVGSSFRPDILIADWMLRSHVHGLHVSRVLRHINPQQQTILITGFPSSDLMLDAESDSVFAFIRKPFDLGELKEKVKQASGGRGHEAFQSQIGFLEFDASETIKYVNPRALELLGFPTTTVPAALAALPIDAEACRTGWSSGDWFTVTTTSSPARKLHIYPLQYTGAERTMLLILDDTHRIFTRSKLVELIIAAHTNRPMQQVWPFEGRVLLVDHNSNLRRVAADLFDSAGTLCHSCDSCAAALKVIERDPGVRYILLDYEMGDLQTFPGGLTKLNNLFRSKVPDVVTIGQSERNRAKEFMSAGISCFVRKPWTIEQLIDSVTGH